MTPKDIKATKALLRYVCKMEDVLENENYHSLSGAYEKIYEGLMIGGVDVVTALKIMKFIGRLMQ